LAANSRSWQLSFVSAGAVWAAIVALAAFWGVWMGLAGRRFIVALGVAAALFAFELFLAAPPVLARVQRILRTRGGTIAPLVPLFAVLVYAFGVTGSWKTMLAGAAYAVVPALLVAGSAGKSPGTWEDYAAAILFWLPVEFRWLYRLFPYPPQLTHTLTVLMTLSTGVAAFVLLRRLDGTGYAIAWGRAFGWQVALHFLAFAAIAIPLGMRIHFIAWDPSFAHVRSLPIVAQGFCSLRPGRRSFFFAGCCRIYFRGR
jgi:hypothetical protein